MAKILSYTKDKVEKADKESVTNILESKGNINPEIITLPEGSPFLADATEHEQSKISRLYDQFGTIAGLRTQSGFQEERFVTFIIKEIVDNALDKKGTKNIKIRIWQENSATLSILISDDGNKRFTEQEIENILKLELVCSTKKFVTGVRRGTLGNAIPTCINIAPAMWKESDKKDSKPEYTTEITGIDKDGFKVKFKINLSYENNQIHPHMVKEVDSNNENTTTLLFKLPIHEYINPDDALIDILSVNPYVTFDYQDEYYHKNHYISALKNVKTASSNEEDWGNVDTYSLEKFRLLLENADTNTARETVMKFKNFGNPGYASRVLRRTSIPLGAKDCDLTSEQIEQLFKCMKTDLVKRKKQTKKRSRKNETLPRVGEENFLKRFGSGNYYWKPGFKIGYDGRSIPFLVEAFSYSIPNKQGHLTQAVNFTANLYGPFTNTATGERTPEKVKLDRPLENAMLGKGLNVILHLVCPNIAWQTNSKGTLDLRIYRKTLSLCLQKVCEPPKSTKLSKDKLVEYANGILAETPEDLQFSIREMHYQIATLHPSEYDVSSSKVADASYQKLDKALTWARETILGYNADGTAIRLIDPDRFVDLSRPEYLLNPDCQSLKGYEATALSKFLDDFDLDRWIDRKFVCELWIEKESLSRIIKPMCEKYRVNLIVGKGYSSFTQIYKANKDRFPRDGRGLRILYFGDHDPSGMNIEEVLTKRLKTEAINQGIPQLNIKVKKIALDDKQIGFIDEDNWRQLSPEEQKQKRGKYNYPHIQIKEYGQGKDEYKAKYGPYIWELEVLNPEQLVNYAEDAILEAIADSDPTPDKDLRQKRETEVEVGKEALRQKYQSFLDELLEKKD